MIFKGYGISKKKIHVNLKIFEKGQYKIFKVKKLFPSIIKTIFLFVNRYTIVANIFVKASDDKYTYWQAMEKIVMVSNKYYSSHEIVNFMNRDLRVPYDYKNYLTEKYGDWKIPVKNWVCGNDVRTIIGNVN